MKEKIIEEAILAKENAYAPYSRFRVGAALLSDDNRIFSGSNVENSSYGLTVCAERTAVFKAASDGVRRIKIIAVVTDSEEPVSPCGACRQVIREFADSDTTIIMKGTSDEILEVNLSELLPLSFGPEFLLGDSIE